MTALRLTLIGLALILAHASCGRSQQNTSARQQEAAKLLALVKVLRAKGVDLDSRPIFVSEVRLDRPKWIEAEIVDVEPDRDSRESVGVVLSQDLPVGEQNGELNVLRIGYSRIDVGTTPSFKGYLDDLMRLPPSEDVIDKWSEAEIKVCATELINKTGLMARGKSILAGAVGENKVIAFCDDERLVSAIIWTSRGIWSCVIRLDAPDVDSKLKDLVSYLQGINLITTR